MDRESIRKNAVLLKWARAVAFFAVMYLALRVLPFYPVPVRLGLAAACSALGFVAPAVGVLVFVVATALPLVAADFLVGVLFLLVGLAAVQYLGQDDARVFLVVSLAFLAALMRAEWALAAIAGYAMGASEGAVAAFFAAAAIEAAGFVLGRTSVGVLATGGTAAFIDLAKLRGIAAPLTFKWLGPAIAGIRLEALLKTLSSLRDLPLMIAQPVLWGIAAALAGTLRRRNAGAQRALSVAVVAGVTALLAAAGIGIGAALGSPVPTAQLAVAGAASVVMAAIFAVVAETVFPEVAQPAATGLSTIRTEDADVDELLRTIAGAEEALGDRHSTDATVMITDMKSFSRMTQERGAVSTAKIIQKHRDLLLPIIREAGGHGKSTGGDGIVASFASADDALTAAVETQRALKRYNEGKAEDRRIHVRIGLASGDVILDRGGCPFIGDAINIAARVMGLADGGQVFGAADVVDAAAKLPSPVVSHGEFSLKNIARPVNIYEILWDADQQPRRPETEAATA